MHAANPITIVGGGLAGLTLGIGLRRRDIPVTIWEAGGYPRHRVCGEFISGNGSDVLRRMDLWEPIRHAGATMGLRAKFFLGTTATPTRSISPPALCLSRFTLDQLLAERFRHEGGDLRENARYEVKDEIEGIVRTSGRRARPADGGPRWFGLKIHAREVELEADLEMHAFRHGYVGLCRLPDGVVNVCGLFQARTGQASTPPRELLRGEPGSPLRRRLQTARLDNDSFCAVAGLPLHRGRATDQTECRLGDALTMIPPITGNGMSMALEAAEMAIEPIRAYACGELSWSAARQAVAQACDSAFRRRLFWAAWLQSMVLLPACQGRLGGWLLHSDWLWNLVFARTR